MVSTYPSVTAKSRPRSRHGRTPAAATPRWYRLPSRYDYQPREERVYRGSLNHSTRTSQEWYTGSGRGPKAKVSLNPYDQQFITTAGLVAPSIGVMSPLGRSPVGPGIVAGGGLGVWVLDGATAPTGSFNSSLPAYWSPWNMDWGQFIYTAPQPFAPVDPLGIGTGVTTDGWFHPWAEYRRCAANPGIAAQHQRNLILGAFVHPGELAGVNCANNYNTGPETEDWSVLVPPPGVPNRMCSFDTVDEFGPGVAKVLESIKMYNGGGADPGWLDPTETVDTPGHGTTLRPAHSEEPEAFPMEAPIRTPTPQRWADAIPAPWTQPSVRPRPGTVPHPLFPPMIPWPAWVVDAEEPPVIPDQWVDLTPEVTRPGAQPSGVSEPPVFRPAPPSGVLGPPPRGTKEKKLNVRTTAGVGWVVINMATEAVDFIESAWKALPEECRSKGEKHLFDRRDGRGKVWGRKPVDPFQMAVDVYNCFDDFDWSKFMENLINNQIEDMFYGILGQQAGSASRNLAVTTGLSRALKQAQEAVHEAEGDRGDDRSSLELPEVRWDPVAGVWHLEWAHFSTQN